MLVYKIFIPLFLIGYIVAWAFISPPKYIEFVLYKNDKRISEYYKSLEDLVFDPVNEDVFIGYSTWPKSDKISFTLVKKGYHICSTEWHDCGDIYCSKYLKDCS